MHDKQNLNDASVRIDADKSAGPNAGTLSPAYTKSFMEKRNSNMNNVIICQSCGCRGKAIRHGHPGDSDLPLFCHLGHDVYTGDMHYQCASCGVLLRVDPMQMLSGRHVPGIASGYGNPRMMAASVHFEQQH